MTNPEMVAVDGEKLMVAFTCTVAAAEVTPAPDAVMVAEPRFTPVIAGCVAGAVWPLRIVIVEGEMVTLDVSLLASAMVRLAWAGLARLTANGAVAPNPTEGDAGRFTVAGAVMVTLAVASAMFGRLLAWITTAPGATGVTVMVAVLWPAVNDTVAGTVAIAVLLELTFTVRPPAGAFADRFKVRFCGVPVPRMVRLGGV